MSAVLSPMPVPVSAVTGGRVSDAAMPDQDRVPAVPVIAPLTVLTSLSWAAFAASPWLMRWPLLLIALNPRMLFLVLAAPKLGLMEFTAVATARLCVADPFSYVLGMRYGGRIRERLDRSRLRALLLRVVPIERTACLAGIWLRPSQSMLVWAGSLRLSPRMVALADVVTTVAYVIAIHEGIGLFS